MDAEEIAREIGLLNAEYDQLYKETEELYGELKDAVGDPGHYRDVMWAIGRKEERMERIGDRLAQLKRLIEQF